MTGRMGTTGFRISIRGTYLNGFETSVQSLFQKSLLVVLDFLAFAFGFAAPVAACGGGVNAAAGLTGVVLVVLVVAVLGEAPAAVVPVPLVAVGVAVVVVAPLVDGAAVDAAVLCPVVVAAVDDELVVPDEVAPFSRLSRLSRGVACAGVVCEEVVVGTDTDGADVWVTGVTET